MVQLLIDMNVKLPFNEWLKAVESERIFKEVLGIVNSIKQIKSNT